MMLECSYGLILKGLKQKVMLLKFYFWNKAKKTLREIQWETPITTFDVPYFIACIFLKCEIGAA